MKATFIQLPPAATQLHRLHYMRASEIRDVEVLDANPKNERWQGPILRLVMMRGGSEDYPFVELESATSAAMDIILQLNGDE